MPAQTLLEAENLNPEIRALTGLLNAFDEGGLVLLDRDGRILVWSQGAGRLEGYAATSMIGECFASGFAAEGRESQVWRRWLAEAARVGCAGGASAACAAGWPDLLGRCAHQGCAGGICARAAGRTRCRWPAASLDGRKPAVARHAAERACRLLGRDGRWPRRTDHSIQHQGTSVQRPGSIR